MDDARANPPPAENEPPPPIRAWIDRGLVAEEGERRPPATRKRTITVRTDARTLARWLPNAVQAARDDAIANGAPIPDSLTLHPLAAVGPKWHAVYSLLWQAGDRRDERPDRWLSLYVSDLGPAAKLTILAGDDPARIAFGERLRDAIAREFAVLVARTARPAPISAPPPSSPVPVPAPALPESAQKLLDLYRDIQRDHGRLPTEDEAAQALDLSVRRIADLKKSLRAKRLIPPARTAT